MKSETIVQNSKVLFRSSVFRMELQEQLNEIFKPQKWEVVNLPDVNGVEVFCNEHLITKTVIDFIENEGYEFLNVQGYDRMKLSFRGKG